MASLTVLRSGENGEQHELAAVETVIGRDESCGVQIEGLGLSRQHCSIVRRGKHFYIRDMASENGTWVNGKKIAATELRDGDEVGLGLHASFRFHNDDQAPPLGSARQAALSQDELLPKEEQEESTANRWLVIVVALAALALIAALAHFSLG